MNSPEMQLADSACPNEESEEIHLLRGQIAEHAQKVKTLHASWLIALAIAVGGAIMPVGVAFLYQMMSADRSGRVVTAIEDNYFKSIELVADGISIQHPVLTAENVGLTLDALVKKIDEDATPADTRRKLIESLKAADSERARALSDVYGRADAAWTLAFGLAACDPWVLPILYVAWVALSKRLLERARYKLEYKIIEAKARQLQDKLGEDFFTRLVQINFKYLDQYYFQTHQQANKSFALSVGAAVVGLVIIAAGIVMMLAGRVDAARLTAASGVISQFIAAVFFYLYNRTVLKMGEYHKKLVLTQNIGIALKITDLLPAAEKAETQRALVGQLTFNINQFLSEIETGVAAPVAA
jgi:hypothetical protein